MISREDSVLDSQLWLKKRPRLYLPNLVPLLTLSLPYVLVSVKACQKAHLPPCNHSLILRHCAIRLFNSTVDRNQPFSFYLSVLYLSSHVRTWSFFFHSSTGPHSLSIKIRSLSSISCIHDSLALLVITLRLASRHLIVKRPI